MLSRTPSVWVAAQYWGLLAGKSFETGNTMKTATTTDTASRWVRALLRALLLVALILVLLFCGFSGFSAQRAFADESQTDPSLEQQEMQSSGSGSESQHYKVYSFDRQDIIDAQTNQSNTPDDGTIPDLKVPLAGFSPADQNLDGAGRGSRFNTGLAVLCIVSLLVMLLMLFIRKTRDYRVLTVQTVAVAFGLVTIAAWVLLDRLQIPTVLFNDVSALLAVCTGIYLVVAVASYVLEARLKKVRTTQDR